MLARHIQPNFMGPPETGPLRATESRFRPVCGGGGGNPSTTPWPYQVADEAFTGLVRIAFGDVRRQLRANEVQRVHDQHRHHPCTAKG